MQNKFTNALKVSTLALALSFGLSYVYAWTAPTVSAPGGNVAAPINTSAFNQTKAGDIAINGGSFLDTGTTIPTTPAGGTAAVAKNGWPNYSDVAANAVKLAGLTSADILAAQTAAAGGGLNMYVAYGNVTCATGFSMAYSGHLTVVYGNPTNGVTTLQGMGLTTGQNIVCSGGYYPALTSSMGAVSLVGSEFWPVGNHSVGDKVMSCAVCVR